MHGDVTVPDFYHYATLTVDSRRERFMNLIPLKYDNENYYVLVFLTLFDYFSGFFFSALLEDVLYHVSSSSKLTRHRNALKSTNIV